MTKIKKYTIKQIQENTVKNGIQNGKSEKYLILRSDYILCSPASLYKPNEQIQYFQRSSVRHYKTLGHLN